MHSLFSLIARAACQTAGFLQPADTRKFADFFRRLAENNINHVNMGTDADGKLAIKPICPTYYQADADDAEPFIPDPISPSMRPVPFPMPDPMPPPMASLIPPPMLEPTPTIPIIIPVPMPLEPSMPPIVPQGDQLNAWGNENSNLHAQAPQLPIQNDETGGLLRMNPVNTDPISEPRMMPSPQDQVHNHQKAILPVFKYDNNSGKIIDLNPPDGINQHPNPPVNVPDNRGFWGQPQENQFNQRHPNNYQNFLPQFQEPPQSTNLQVHGIPRDFGSQQPQGPPENPTLNQQQPHWNLQAVPLKIGGVQATQPSQPAQPVVLFVNGAPGANTANSDEVIGKGLPVWIPQKPALATRAIPASYSPTNNNATVESDEKYRQLVVGYQHLLKKVMDEHPPIAPIEPLPQWEAQGRAFFNNPQSAPQGRSMMPNPESESSPKSVTVTNVESLPVDNSYDSSERGIDVMLPSEDTKTLDIDVSNAPSLFHLENTDGGHRRQL